MNDRWVCCRWRLRVFAPIRFVVVHCGGRGKMISAAGTTAEATAALQNALRHVDTAFVRSWSFAINASRRDGTLEFHWLVVPRSRQTSNEWQLKHVPQHCGVTRARFAPQRPFYRTTIWNMERAEATAVTKGDLR